jgi:hypothetical protein
MKYQRASSRAIFVDTDAHAAFIENERVPLPQKPWNCSNSSSLGGKRG